MAITGYAGFIPNLNSDSKYSKSYTKITKQKYFKIDNVLLNKNLVKILSVYHLRDLILQLMILKIKASTQLVTNMDHQA